MCREILPFELEREEYWKYWTQPKYCQFIW